MNTMPAPADVAPTGNYEATRFNALRHGVLSRYAVLPREDEGEYPVLLGALVAEHAPEGPTEEHLVEEVAGIIWRKRRLRLAEAAIFREKPSASNRAAGAHGESWCPKCLRLRWICLFTSRAWTRRRHQAGQCSGC